MKLFAFDIRHDNFWFSRSTAARHKCYTYVFRNNVSDVLFETGQFAKPNTCHHEPAAEVWMYKIREKVFKKFAEIGSDSMTVFSRVHLSTVHRTRSWVKIIANP